jgi:hypothetical protein
MPKQAAIVELRRYTLHQGAREALIDLFDGELIEPQEDVGMHVLSQFRDIDDPDCLVWLRGFPDMAARAAGLEAFYGGPVWREHRDAANATMIDSDDVLLLRPARPGSGLPLDGGSRPPRNARGAAPGLLVITTHACTPAGARDFPEFFEDELVPALHASGAEVLAGYRTEPGPNNYPALPVREGEDVFVSVMRFADEVAHARHVEELERSREWSRIADGITRRIEAEPQVARLTPTARSLLRA